MGGTFHRRGVGALAGGVQPGWGAEVVAAAGRGPACGLAAVGVDWKSLGTPYAGKPAGPCSGFRPGSGAPVPSAAGEAAAKGAEAPVAFGVGAADGALFRGAS